MVVETAFAQLGLGRTLLALSRMDEAAEALAAARSILADLQAASAIAEIDNLLRSGECAASGPERRSGRTQPAEPPAPTPGGGANPRA